MVKAMIAFILISNAYTSEFNQRGVVLVLEAPLFHSPNKDARVVQYLRKGDFFYIHPSEFNESEYDGLRETIPDTKVTKYNSEFNKANPDLFLGKARVDQTVDYGDYIRTRDRRGHDAYILREHTKVFYKSKSELSQNSFQKDETDYRLEEPLLQDHPFIRETGYKTIFTVGLGPQNENHYEYSSNIESKGYSFRKDIALTWLKHWKKNSFSQKLFYGFSGVVSSATSEVNFSSFNAIENYLKIGIGPTLFYSHWSNRNYAISSSASLIINFWDQVDLSINNKSTGVTEDVLFSKFSFDPRYSLTIHRKNLYKDIGVVFGAHLLFFLPSDYSAETNTNQKVLFPNKNFSKQFSTELNIFFGFQSSLE